MMLSSRRRLDVRLAEVESSQPLTTSLTASLPAVGSTHEPLEMSASARDSHADASDFVVNVSLATCRAPSCQ